MVFKFLNIFYDTCVYIVYCLLTFSFYWLYNMQNQLGWMFETFKDHVIIFIGNYSLII